MQTLLIEAAGRVLRFDSERPIRIGRSIEADVVLTAGTVSRAHAELRPTDAGWLLVDVGSSGGTFVDGLPVTERAIEGPTVVQCGPGAPGSSITVTPEQQAPPELTSAPSQAPAPVHGPGPFPAVVAAPGAPDAPQAAPPTASASDEPEMTVVPGAMPALPAERTGPDLLVVAEGREHRFRHPADLALGRHPDCDIVLADQACSRRHAQLSAVPGGWIYTNLSKEGSFAGGRPVAQQEFDESLVVRLGHPVAGPEVSLIPILSAEEEVARFARRRRNQRLKVAAGVAGAAALVAAVVSTVVLLGGSDEPTTTSRADSMAELTAAEQEAAMAATVWLTYRAVTPEGPGMVTGSGSVISDDGLILTNAHVAAPQTAGLEELYPPSIVPDPDHVEVHLTDPDNGFRTNGPDYRARLLAADGRMDIAVLQIEEDATGSPVDRSELGLPVLPLGDSDQLRTRAEVTILGFPGLASAFDGSDPTESRPSVSVTTGVVSTFVDTRRLGERSEIDTDARIAPGNSGGPVINNDGEIVGVASAFVQPNREVPIVSGRARPSALAVEVVEQARAAR